MKLRSCIAAILVLLALTVTGCRPEPSPAPQGTSLSQYLRQGTAEQPLAFYRCSQLDEAAVPEAIYLFAGKKVLNYGNPERLTLKELMQEDPAALAQRLDEAYAQGLEQALETWRGDPMWAEALADGSATVYVRQKQEYFLSLQPEGELLFLPVVQPYGADYVMLYTGVIFSTQAGGENGFIPTQYPTSFSASGNMDTFGDLFFLGDFDQELQIGDVRLTGASCHTGSIEGISGSFGQEAYLLTALPEGEILRLDTQADGILYDQSPRNVYVLAERLYLDQLNFWRSYEE